MKNILGFATAFAAALLVVGIVRASVLSRGEAAPAPIKEDHSEHAQPQAGPDKKADSKDKEETPTKEKPIEKPAAMADLCNENDPVTDEKLGETKILLEHKSWRIGFATDAAKKRFEKNPVRYYAKLSLEPTSDGKLLKVDASKYEKATAEKCAIMGGDIDPDGDVFILHRGFKVFFCCWSGCADEFLKDPSKYYEHYGLVEKDGKLARK